MDAIVSCNWGNRRIVNCHWEGCCSPWCVDRSTVRRQGQTKEGVLCHSDRRLRPIRNQIFDQVENRSFVWMPTCHGCLIGCRLGSIRRHQKYSRWICRCNESFPPRLILLMQLLFRGWAHCHLSWNRDRMLFDQTREDTDQANESRVTQSYRLEDGATMHELYPSQTKHRGGSQAQGQWVDWDTIGPLPPATMGNIPPPLWQLSIRHIAQGRCERGTHL